MAIREDSKIERNLITDNLKTRADFRAFLLTEWIKEST